MFYKIVEVSTDKASGHTYVLVHFWLTRGDFSRNKPPFRKNDFLMQLRPTEERAVTNIDGWPNAQNGTFIDPSTLGLDQPQPEWELETVNRDLPAEIKANIEAYWQRTLIKPLPLDHTNPRIQRDESDPHGVLARPDVTALRGARVDRP